MKQAGESMQKRVEFLWLFQKLIKKKYFILSFSVIIFFCRLKADGI